MIYTGFKDKNLNEIYMGHRIKKDAGHHYIVREKVNLQKPDCRFWLECEKDKYLSCRLMDFFDDVIDDCVIVGNGDDYAV